METKGVKHEEPTDRPSVLDNLASLPNISLRSLYYRIKRAKKRQKQLAFKDGFAII